MSNQIPELQESIESLSLGQEAVRDIIDFESVSFQNYNIIRKYF